MVVVVLVDVVVVFVLVAFVVVVIVLNLSLCSPHRYVNSFSYNMRRLYTGWSGRCGVCVPTVEKSIRQVCCWLMIGLCEVLNGAGCVDRSVSVVLVVALVCVVGWGCSTNYQQVVSPKSDDD